MAQEIKFDSIDREKVIVSGIRLEDSPGTMMMRIGKPDTIIAKVNEFEGTEYRDYVYGKARFSVADNKVTGFQLNGGSYRIGSTHPISVGDSTAALRQLFPQSFSSQFAGEDDSVIVKVRIANSDSYILFVSENGRITEIKTWDDL